MCRRGGLYLISSGYVPGGTQRAVRVPSTATSTPPAHHHHTTTTPPPLTTGAWVRLLLCAELLQWRCPQGESVSFLDVFWLLPSRMVVCRVLGHGVMVCVKRVTGGGGNVKLLLPSRRGCVSSYIFINPRPLGQA